LPDRIAHEERESNVSITSGAATFRDPPEDGLREEDQREE
jgi:hypothetical protein